MINYRKLILLLLLLTILSGGYWIIQTTLFNLSSEEFYAYISTWGSWTPLLIIGLIIGEIIILPLAGNWLWLSMGFMFGPWLGTIYTFIALLVGCIGIFELGKLTHHTLHSQTENFYLQSITRKIYHTPSVIVTLLAVPLFPIDILVLFLGYLNLPRKFIYICLAIGAGLQAIIDSFFGTSIAWQENYFLIELSLIVLVLGYFLMVQWVRKKQ